MEYLRYKMIYTRAKIHRKLRVLTAAEQDCNMLIDAVGELKETTEPKPWWKFALKACFVRSVLLGSCFEFATPKRQMTELAPKLVDLLQKHYNVKSDYYTF